jgi:hypothetical protein
MIVILIIHCLNLDTVAIKAESYGLHLVSGINNIGIA